MRLTAAGDFRPAGKRARWLACDDDRMQVGWIGFLHGGNEYYRVEKKY